MHNFNKYSVFDFNKISSIDSKFDTLNKFHKALKKLQGVKIKNENTNQRKITVLKNASLLYANLVDIYKKEYDLTFENKDKNWRLKHNYKNLKDLHYQSEQMQQSDQLVVSKWVITVQSRFNKIQRMVTEGKTNGLKTKVGDKVLELNNAQRVLKEKKHPADELVSRKP